MSIELISTGGRRCFKKKFTVVQDPNLTSKDRKPLKINKRSHLLFKVKIHFYIERLRSLNSSVTTSIIKG